MIYFITGVSGSGKTTIGKELSVKLSLPFFDGDEFHPKENIQKMSNQRPLNDSDRAPWLLAINKKARRCLQTGGAVFSCSALKEAYRQALVKNIPPNSFRWIHLNGDRSLVLRRIQRRKDHFMPSSLLDSQFEDREEPSEGLKFNIDQEVGDIIDKIMENIEKSEVGLIGLGVMGTSLARNIAKRGFGLSIFNRFVKDKEERVAEEKRNQHQELQKAKAFEDLWTFVESIVTPRKIILMVSAGKAVDILLEDLLPVLEAGDIVIDGGNSHYEDTERRTRILEEKKMFFIGSGISGGEKGALLGPSIMPGGNPNAYEDVRHILEAVAAKNSNNEPCCDYIGTGGAGHFVKMVHNGIEYAEMQLICEVYETMKYLYGMSNLDISKAFLDWSGKGSKSYLLDISIEILKTQTEDQEFILDQILDQAGNKGTGSWTTIAACNLGVAIPSLTAALFARYTSSNKKERVRLSQHYKIEKKKVTEEIEMLHNLYKTCRILNHRQGFKLIEAASEANDWSISLLSLTKVWSAGCIIESDLLRAIGKAIQEDFQDLILYTPFKQHIKKHLSSVFELSSKFQASSLPLHCIASSISYLKLIIQEQSSANLIQAQRDYFGAHRFRWKHDSEGPAVHLEWEKL